MADLIIGLAPERCRELLSIARRNQRDARQLVPAILGYCQAFAAAGMKEGEIEGQLPITIPCNAGIRRRFLKTLSEQLERAVTSEDVLEPLQQGGRLHDETIVAIRRDVQSLATPPPQTARALRKGT